MTRKIQPRKKGSGWYVHVPVDLRATIGKNRASFKTERDAKRFASNLEFKREAKSRMSDIKEMLRDFESLSKILDGSDKLPAISLGDAFAKVIESKERSGKRSNTVATLTCSLKSFAAHCHKPAGDVLPADIEAWLYDNTWTPKTRKGRLVDLKTGYSWLVRSNLVESNPAEKVDSPSVTFRAPPILSVESIEKLLRAAEQGDPAMLAFFCLVLFGGLRVAEARRCLVSNLAKDIIDLGGESCKLNFRRCIKMSPQLSAWIARWRELTKPQDSDKIGVVKFHERMKAIRQLAGVEIPANALRHSFCSYNLELFGADTAARMANNSPDMLFKHYAAKVTPEDSKRFALILPVKTIDAFSTTAP